MVDVEVERELLLLIVISLLLFLHWVIGHRVNGLWRNHVSQFLLSPILIQGVFGGHLV
jgi:phosphoglycerol transferase MdoB-like AlkP superfamily enzyme